MVVAPADVVSLGPWRTRPWDSGRRRWSCAFWRSTSPSFARPICVPKGRFPVRNILGPLHLSARGAGETNVLWHIHPDDEAAWGPVCDGIEALHRSGIDGLEARHAALPFSGIAEAEGRR